MASLNGSSQSKPQQNAPSWLRPFFSLKVQLASAFSLLLILVITFSYLFFSQRLSPLEAALDMIILIVLGTDLPMVSRRIFCILSHVLLMQLRLSLLVI